MEAHSPSVSIARTPFTSRAVPSAGYDAAHRTLELEFASGHVYRYFDVPPTVFQWLVRAPSKGAYVSRMIDGKYPFERVGARDVAPQDLMAALRASLKQGPAQG